MTDDPAAVFYRTVCHKQARCIVTGKTARELREPLQAHHVLTRQALRRHGHGDKIWDPRNGVPIARRAHERHTQAVERIPRRLLPPEAESFAEELGLDWLLDRQYP